MCGRMYCGLNKQALQYACQYQGAATGSYECPDWHMLKPGDDYVPSYNTAPHTSCPVLVHSRHAAGGTCESERVATVMHWGLVPSWFREDPQAFRTNTINCRSEGCTERSSFKPAIASGYRCVVLAEGYFEWSAAKKPHAVYFKQPEGISMTDRFWDSVDGIDERLVHGGRWQGPRLLTMAGLFDISQGGHLYSFSVMTAAAPQYLRWLHSRVPVILDGEQAVRRWLDPDVRFQELLPTLSQCPPDLQWHPVATKVGHVANKTVECVLPPKVSPAAANLPGTFMDRWLKGKDKAPPKERSRSRSPVKTQQPNLGCDPCKAEKK